LWDFPDDFGSAGDLAAPALHRDLTGVPFAGVPVEPIVHQATEVTMSSTPGRELSSQDVAAFTELLRETEQRHGEYEATAPKHHWSGWYAAYIVARERGRTPDEAARDAALHMKGAGH
jgi:hypothetical protein